MYAIGGTENPNILSQGNRFKASAKRFAKEVTKRQNVKGSEWKNWNWRSEGQLDYEASVSEDQVEYFPYTQVGAEMERRLVSV